MVGIKHGWLYYFTGAKQSATRTSRIEKAAKAILAGRGLRLVFSSLTSG